MKVPETAVQRALPIVLVTIFLDLMGITLIIPFINDLVAELGGDERHVGFLLASYAFMQLIFAPVWGRISDRIGRRPVIIIGLLGSAVAFLIFGMAGQLWLLFASRMLAGTANANISTAQAYVADISPADKRAGRMGLVGASFSLGFIVGFPVGGILSTQFGFRAPVFFAAALSLLNAFAALFLLPESYPAEKRSRGGRTAIPMNPMAVLQDTLRVVFHFWRRGALRPVFTMFLLFTISFSIIHVTFVEYARDVLNMSPQVRGFVFMFIGLVGAVTQATVVKRMVHRIGEGRTIQWGLLSMALGLGLVPFLRSVHTIYLANFFIALGNGLVNPATMALISNRIQDHEQGSAMGVAQSLGSMGRIIGPPYGGLTYARINFYFPFLSAAAGALLALALFSRNHGRATGGRGPGRFWNRKPQGVN